tara:strand:+ start:10539 stop:10889 length:351 start_codon:yes stop_codon:yes gene_type:complete
MKNLTECGTYKDVVLLIKDNGWNSTQVASKCWHYHQNIALSKTDKTLKKRQEVYEWLCRYQEEFHIGNKPSKYKDFIVGLLLSGQSVTQVHKGMLAAGFIISKSVIYKYKKGLDEQ